MHARSCEQARAALARSVTVVAGRARAMGQAASLECTPAAGGARPIARASPRSKPLNDPPPARLPARPLDRSTTRRDATVLAAAERDESTSENVGACGGRHVTEAQPCGIRSAQGSDLPPTSPTVDQGEENKERHPAYADPEVCKE